MEYCSGCGNRFDGLGSLCSICTQTEKIIAVLERHKDFQSKSSCFVATAAYNDHMHEDVVYLRFFRDNFLVRTRLGVCFVNFYWVIGPKLAIIVNKSSALQKFSRFILSRLIKLLKNYFPQHN